MWIDPWGLCHGNSKASKKPNHVYVIFNKKTGEVYKFGISGGKISKAGKSYRAQMQVRVLNILNPGVYASKIVKKGLTRTKALSYEQGRVNKYSVAAQRAGSTGVGRSGSARTANGPIGPEGNVKPPPTM